MTPWMLSKAWTLLGKLCQLLLGVWLPLCICMWGLPVSVAFNETTSLSSKMFRIKTLNKYARAGARLAASVWLSCFLCCDSLFKFGISQRRPLASCWSQSHSRQIKGQNLVSENKFEKQILLLLHASAHAALPILLLAEVLLCSYIAPSPLLRTFLLNSLNSEPGVMNTSSKCHLYSFFASHELCWVRLSFWLGDLPKKPSKPQEMGLLGQREHPSLPAIFHIAVPVVHCKAVEIVFWTRPLRFPWVISQNMLARFQFEYSYTFQNITI